MRGWVAWLLEYTEKAKFLSTWIAISNLFLDRSLEKVLRHWVLPVVLCLAEIDNLGKEIRDISTIKSNVGRELMIIGTSCCFLLRHGHFVLSQANRLQSFTIKLVFLALPGFQKSVCFSIELHESTFQIDWFIYRHPHVPHSKLCPATYSNKRSQLYWIYLFASPYIRANPLSAALSISCLLNANALSIHFELFNVLSD